MTGSDIGDDGEELVIDERQDGGAERGTDGSGLVETLPDAGEPRRRRAPWVAGGLLVGALALGYGGAAWWSGGQVPTGTIVAGIDVGGRSEREAATVLEQGAADLLAAPAEVTIGQARAQVVPADAGLAADVPRTLDPLTGFSLDPRVVLARFVGGGEEPLVTRVADEGALEGAMSALAEQHDTSPVDGAVTLADGTAEATDAQEGVTLETGGAATVFADAWPADGPIELPVMTAEPRVDQADVDTAMETIATPLTSGPVTVKVAEHTVELAPSDLTSVARLETDDEGAMSLELDEDALRRMLGEKNPALRGEAQDARIEIREGAPTVIPSQTGMGLDPAVTAQKVAETATSTETRTVELEMSQTEPELTTQEAEALGVKEPIAEFATNLTADSVRTRNLIIGSQKITNTLVLPGQEFSLLRTLGPVTRENGFVSSGVINSGFTDEAVGGGLSQLSTNTYNAGFLAGMVDVEHKPHSRYYSRYPAGREATLWDPEIDMRWKNDTPHGVLVEAWVAGGQQHVRLWSTRYWEVHTSTSGRYAVVAPDTRVNTSASCEPEGPGPAGFTIDIFRERWREGAKVDDQSWTWTYNPWHRVVCQ